MRQAIRAVTNMMRLDYGGLFTHQFPKDDRGREREVQAWQYRLLAKARGLDPKDLLDGYDFLLGEKPSELPKIPELVAATLQMQKQRLKAERDNEEAQRIAALPPPKEMSESVAQQNLAKIRALLSDACADMGKRETEGERQARLKRLDDKVAAHEALLDAAFPHRHRPRVMERHHECAVGWCLNPGTLSHSTNGGSFFCREHFKPSGK